MKKGIFCFSIFCLLAACTAPNREYAMSVPSEHFPAKWDRILIPLKINQQPVHFIFDTGADISCLTEQAAKRLGLKINPSKDPFYHWLPGFTEKCTVQFNGLTRKDITFPVIRIPDRFEADGCFGWLWCHEGIFYIDAANRKITAYRKVPQEMKSWQRFPLRLHARKFIFQVPLANRTIGEVFVDTGSTEGLCLYPEGWAKWRVENPRRRVDVTQAYMPYLNTGMVVQLASFADKIQLGPLEITNVRVQETNPVVNREYSPPRRLATMGMAALRRLDVLVDGRGGYVYIRPKK